MIQLLKSTSIALLVIKTSWVLTKPLFLKFPLTLSQSHVKNTCETIWGKGERIINIKNKKKNVKKSAKNSNTQYKLSNVKKVSLPKVKS